ncbi:similar to Saccharomyces cerevisiae YOR289W Putative protein of unknown function [Maudiozyma saulgeensis]|uniref:AMMECR1 domain-containing protein n=1 Tax=Maudiozyma saulgeensis TaxID=1789683 RepID=A0A1X7R524_9SACH|nr:similar to Saccharomyces cerevisiae YOR289W Putative protein of unknown function [Kazachstania saulgeensis]
MTESIISGSPQAFYAFYCLYSYFMETQGHEMTLSKVCRELYPSVKVNLEEKTSLFVTWKKKPRGKDEYQLRGCIGTFSKLPLDEGIQRFALVSALEDTRFHPISENDLTRLKCYCNVLQNFETIYDNKKRIKENDIFNWTIGKHGIELRFKDPHGSKIRSATFLPDVMTEQGWDKSETFKNLLEKAGCLSNIDEIMEHYDQYFVDVVRYEGNKSSITYKEFKVGLDKVSEK